MDGREGCRGGSWAEEGQGQGDVFGGKKRRRGMGDEKKERAAVGVRV